MSSDAASDALRSGWSVGRFHALQGINYVLSTAYVTYAAVARDRTRPAVVGAIANDLVFNSFDGTCLALWVYVFSCVHAIGWSYVCTGSDAYTHYATETQLAFVTLYGLRLMMKMPNCAVGALMVSVDGLGALGKFCLIRVSRLGVVDVPPEKRVRYFKIPKPRSASTLFIMHERLAVLFSICYIGGAIFVLEFGRHVSALANMRNPNTIGMVSAGLFVTGILSHSWIPALRQGSFGALFVMIASKSLLALIIITHRSLPDWFRFSINMPFFTIMTAALMNIFFHHAFNGPIFVGPTREGFHMFGVSLASMAHLFILGSLLYTNLWYQGIATGVMMPEWGRLQVPLLKVNFPILRTIARRLSTLSFPVLRLRFGKEHALLRGDAELARISMMQYSIVLHAFVGISTAVIRKSAFSDQRMLRSARLIYGVMAMSVSYTFCDHFLVARAMSNPWTRKLHHAPSDWVGVDFTIWLIMMLSTYACVRGAVHLSRNPDSSGQRTGFTNLRGRWRMLVLKHFALQRQVEKCAWINGVLVLCAMLPIALLTSGIPHPVPLSDTYLIAPKPVPRMSAISPLLLSFAAHNLMNPSFPNGVALSMNTFAQSTITLWFVIISLYYKALTGKSDKVSRTLVHILLGCPLRSCDAKRFENAYLESVETDVQIILLCLAWLRVYLQHIALVNTHETSKEARPRFHAIQKTTKMMCTLGALSHIWHILIRLVRIIGAGALSNSMVDLLRRRLMTLSAFESADSIIEDSFHVGYFCLLTLALTHSVLTSGISSFGRFLKPVMRVVRGVYFMHMLVFVSRFSWLCGYTSTPWTLSLFLHSMGWTYVWFQFAKATQKLIHSVKNRVVMLSTVKVRFIAALFKRGIVVPDEMSTTRKSSFGRILSKSPSTSPRPLVAVVSQWQNHWVKCYKAAFGDEMFDAASNSEFPIPMPPPNAFGLLVMQLKIAFMFVFGTLMQKRRPTHPVGVGAIGQFTVIENSKVPKNAFFTKGKTMPIILRHSNAVGVKLADSEMYDDASLEIRGCALKFSNAVDESPFDLHLNTGEFAGFFNLDSFLPFVFQMATFNDSAYKAWGMKYPTGIKAGIGGVRRAPDSYCDLHYYSQTCREFHALDGKKRYCKFRLVPYGAGPGTDVGQEPFLPDEADQNLIATTHMMKYRRLPNEKRLPDYLRNEFCTRVAGEAVRYRLQIQLYEATSSDTAEIFNPNKAWGTEFLDVGVVRLHAALPQHSVENLSFGMNRTPACMPLTRPINSQDYNSLNWTRAVVYETSYKIRRVFTRGRKDVYAPEASKKYTIKVTTHSIAGSGIDGDVVLQFVGTRGATPKIVLDDLGDSFATGAISTHFVHADDIGEPAYAIISQTSKSSWNCGRIDVTFTSQIPTSFTLNVWRYIGQGVRFVLPCSITPTTSLACRQLIADATEQYLSFMKKEFDWSNGSYLPNHSTYDDHSKLPITEQFSSTKYKDFFVDTFVGFENKGIADMIKDEEIKSLDDYYRLYASLPPVAIIRDWRSDEEFGRQFMNGTHPNQVRKVSQIPAKFRVTEEHVRGVLPPGKTLESELAAGHIFMVDYEILEDIKRGQGYCVENSMALFFADKSTALRPICIQHFQSGASAPVWTPKDGEYEWLLAKAHLMCSDGNVHQMISHLLGTHLLMEPWSVCVERTLPRNHPVYRVLRPHLIYVIAINTLGRSLLISPGGVTDRVVAVGQGGHMDLMSKAYQRFKLDDLHVPTSFKKRGVLSEGDLRGYHHRDDSLRAWACLRRFAKSIFKLHYTSDAEVAADPYIQSMILEMQGYGYQGTDRSQHGVPGSIDSIDQLVDICTSVMYTCSFTHAAVNFSQWDYYSYCPNRPLIMRKPAPTKKVPVTEKDVIDALPSVGQAAQTMATGWTLSQFSKEEVFVGHYITDMMITPAEIAALQDLRSELRAMGRQIENRNAKLGVKAYPYMHPERVPSNIGV